VNERPGAHRQPTHRAHAIGRGQGPTAWRAIAVLGAVAGCPFAVLVSALLIDLPSRLAIAWQAGTPSASVDVVPLTVTAAAVGTLAVAVAGAVLAAPSASFLGRRAALSVAAAIAGAAAGLWGLWVVTAVTAVDPVSPPPPDLELLVPLISVLVTMRLVGLAYGAAAHDPSPRPPDPALPRADIPVGAAPRWRHDGVSGFFLAAVLALSLLGALSWRAAPVAGLTCWVMAGLTAVLVRIRLEIDERGLALSAWGRGPAMVLPWARIVEAHAVRIRPVQWGGWGFRVVPRRSSVGLRKGPGLVLTLTDGRRLGITLDEPVLPAGLVNSHLERVRGGGP